jgi:hypothetical protein
VKSPIVLKAAMNLRSITVRLTDDQIANLNLKFFSLGYGSLSTSFILG